MLDSSVAWLPSGWPTNERAQRGTAEVVRADLTVSRKTANTTIGAEKADAVAGFPSAVWTAFDRSKKRFIAHYRGLRLSRHATSVIA